MLKAEEIEMTPDDHVWITVTTEDRPTISIDLSNNHGRRYFSIRVDGMTTFSGLLDVNHLNTMKEKKIWARFCPFCGEEKNILSSKGHRCKEEEDA